MKCDYEIVNLFKINTKLMSEKSKIIIDFVNNYRERKKMDKEIQSSRTLQEKIRLDNKYLEMGKIQNELFESALNAYQNIIEFGNKNGEYIYVGRTLNDLKILHRDKTIYNQRDKIKDSLFKSMLEYYKDLGEINNSRYYNELDEKSKIELDKSCKYLNETKVIIQNKNNNDIYNQKKELGDYLILADTDVVGKYFEKASEDEFDIRKSIEKMIKYRSLRHRQAYYAGSNYRSNEEIMRLDRIRSQVHNEALDAFLNIIEYGRKNDLPSLLIGDELTSKEIYEHSKNREQMTNAMFDFLNIIQKGRFLTDETKKGSITISTISRFLDREDRRDGVIYGINRDEDGTKNGGIIFDDDKERF